MLIHINPVYQVPSGSHGGSPDDPSGSERRGRRGRDRPRMRVEATGRVGGDNRRPVIGQRGESPEGEPQQPTTRPPGRSGRKANYRTPREGRSGTRRRPAKSVRTRLKPARAKPVELRLKPALRSARPTGLWKTSPVRVQTAAPGFPVIYTTRFDAAEIHRADWSVSMFRPIPPWLTRRGWRVRRSAPRRVRPGDA